VGDGSINDVAAVAQLWSLGKELEEGMTDRLNVVLLALVAVALVATGCSKLGPANIHEALCTPAKQNPLDAVQSYLAKGGDPNLQNDVGQTPLLCATIEKHADIVKLLLAKGANPNITDSLGQTPAFFAAYNQDVDIAGMLINAGADVNARTQSGEFALLRAVTWGHAGMVELLIKGGADVNMKPTDPRVPSPLKIAQDGQMTDIVEMLKKAGATE
jgi:ankyrin repeat protein